MNKYLSKSNQKWYPNGFDFAAVGLADYTVDVAKTGAIWAVGLALIVGIISAILFDYQRVVTSKGINASIGGSLAVMNTASEYGFGAIIASLPGFALISHAMSVPLQSISKWGRNDNRFSRYYRFSFRVV